MRRKYKRGRKPLAVWVRWWAGEWDVAIQMSTAVFDVYRKRCATFDLAIESAKELARMLRVRVFVSIDPDSEPPESDQWVYIPWGCHGRALHNGVS